jgi:ADP-ribose pyrophosphatase YjhB (NUDIX family)
MTVHAGTEGWAFRDEHPFRVRYHLECDPSWRLRRLEVRATGGAAGGAAIALRADGAGHWTNARGDALPELDGAIDVDIAACAFTNLPTIRRLQLAPGASATDRVVYVSVPALVAVAVEQRYTCLSAGRFRYENLTNPYDTVIDVDADGVTRHYPDVFARLWPDGHDLPGPLVASGIVERDGEVLLLRRGAANEHAPGEWEPVSGRVEPDESPSAAVVREVKEETGLDVEVVAPVATFRFVRGAARTECVGLAFHCRAVDGTIALSAEHDASRWVPRDRLAMDTNLTNGVRQGLARLLALPE